MKLGRMLVASTALAAGPPALAAVDPGAASAPRTEFVAPAPGTYRLPHIQSVDDATLLDSAGRSRRLAELTTGKVTLLTFFYASCSDPLGCPFAYGTLHRLRAKLAPQPAIHGRVRFVSVSLDPSHDTPAVLTAYANALSPSAAIEWDFLTSPSMTQLLPLLDDFGQDVSVEVDERGRPTRALHHMLKMFLIDAYGSVREIYSLAFLQSDVIANDISTLLLETIAQRQASQTPRPHRSAGIGVEVGRIERTSHRGYD
jgi:protein SCO1/2